MHVNSRQSNIQDNTLGNTIVNILFGAGACHLCIPQCTAHQPHCEPTHSFNRGSRPGHLQYIDHSFVRYSSGFSGCQAASRVPTARLHVKSAASSPRTACSASPVLSISSCFDATVRLHVCTESKNRTSTFRIALLRLLISVCGRRASQPK